MNNALALLAIAVTASIAGAQTTAAGFFQPGKIRALIISGRNNHDWRATTPFLRQVLTGTGRFDVRVTGVPEGLNHTALAPFDLIILNYVGPRWGSPAEAAIGSAIEMGKGLVVIHGASYPFGEMEVLGDNHKKTGLREPPWPEFARMTGTRWTNGPPRTGHGKRHIFEVEFTDRQHPIALGMADSFAISDELYHRMVLGEGIHVLARAYDSPDIGGTGQKEPVLWTLNYGKGRVFHTTLGHDLSAMQSPGFLTTLARGSEWAASGKVTLPGEILVETHAKDAVKAQVVIGGHDFAPTLWELFSGHDDIVTNVVYQPAAYTRGRLERSDILVLYDMMQPITDAHKANLRRFLESGKGLVVLHHALASYQDWPWYWKEVVGGRYILKDQDAEPSTFKHDIWLRVTPAMSHP
ncbi:MAG: ThuA domain-containing protein, partial [bacterium]|nr:ThuA domain-containing protein [bacterium]